MTASPTSDQDIKFHAYVFHETLGVGKWKKLGFDETA
jgi:hypothetical protein